VAGATMPLLFAVFGAAVPAYGARYNVLFGFLLLVSAALAVIARFREPRWLHLVGGVATVAVLVIWSAVSYNASAWPAVVAWVAVFTIVQLASSWGSKVSMAPGVLLPYPLLAAIGALCSWIVIGACLPTSLDAVNLVAALSVAAGFGLFAIGGAVCARDEAVRYIFLVLFAYVFLVFIAAQAALAIPPWP